MFISPETTLHGDVGATGAAGIFVIEMARFALGPLVKPRQVHYDLALCIQFDMGAVHWPGSRTFKVYALAVVATSMAGAFKFVLARLPVGSTAEMSTARVDYKDAVRGLGDPDAILLLPLCIDSQCIITRRTDAKAAGRLKNGTREEEPQKHEKTCCEKSGYTGPDNPPPHLVDGRIWCAFNYCARRLRGGLYRRGRCRLGRRGRARW